MPLLDFDEQKGELHVTSTKVCRVKRKQGVDTLFSLDNGIVDACIVCMWFSSGRAGARTGPHIYTPCTSTEMRHCAYATLTNRSCRSKDGQAS